MKLYSRKKNSTKIFIAITLLSATIFLVSNYFIDKKSQVVVAKINGEKIFKHEIEKKLRSVFNSKDSKIPAIDSLPKEVIESLARDIYLEKELTEIAKNSKAVKSRDVDDEIKDTKNKILRQIYLSSVLEEEVTDKKINDRYVEITNDLAGKKEYLIAHIVTKSKDEADKILKELKAKKFSNHSFAELAKKYSIDKDAFGKDGNAKYVFEGDLDRKILEVVRNLKRDEVSSSIETSSGWHLVKLSDSRDAEPISFEIAKESIRKQLKQAKLNEINDKITKNASVQVVIELKDPNAAVENKSGEEEVDSKVSDSVSDVNLAVPEPNSKKDETENADSVDATPAVANQQESEQQSTEEDLDLKKDVKDSDAKKSKKSKKDKNRH